WSALKFTHLIASTLGFSRQNGRRICTSTVWPPSDGHRLRDPVTSVVGLDVHAPTQSLAPRPECIRGSLVGTTIWPGGLLALALQSRHGGVDAAEGSA